MNKNVWGKTLLTVYPYLINIADAIDRMVEKKALNSFYVSSNDFLRNNVFDVVDKIIELSERKVVLINIKVLVTDILKKCNKKHAKVLIAKYISKKKNDEICELLNLPPRTYFRMIKLAENEFEEKLLKSGYSELKLYNLIKDETWIVDIKEEIQASQRNRDVEINSLALKKKVAL